MRLSFLFNYFPHVEVIPANIDRAREVQDYNNISFFFFYVQGNNDFEA